MKYMSTILLFLIFNVKSQSQIVIEPAQLPGKPVTFYWNNFWSERPTPYETDFKTPVQIETPFPVRIIATSYSEKRKSFSNTSFVIYPGERVHFIRDGRRILMQTKDAVRNNELRFFSALNVEIGPFEGFSVDFYTPNISLKFRLDDLDDKYARHLKFLENYAKTNAISPAFKSYLESCFLYKNLAQKFDILNQKATISDSLQQLYSLFKFPPSDKFWYLQEYREAALGYLLFKNKSGICAECLDKQLEVARNTFDPQTSDVVALAILNLGQQAKYDSLSTLSETALKLVSNPDISKFIRDTYVGELVPFTNSIAQLKPDQLIDFKSDTTSLSAFIKAQKGKVIFLDFWASWCGPCRASMPKSAELRELLHEKDVTFAYISIDDNPLAWRRASQKEKLDRYAYNHLLPKFKESEFLKKAGLETIPRYMIFDKSGRLIHADAPGPEDPKLPQLLQVLIDKP